MHELTPDAESPARHTERDHGGIGGHPRGLSMLFYAEMWERFSYYGMRALLLLFMITPLAMGGLGFDQKFAAQVYGNYTMASYMVCILGGYLADNFIGARRAVLVGGLIITVGHYALAFDSVPTFYAGLILIALGTGLLKPSISTLVGGLYSHGDTRRDAGFSLFYMGINLGAFAAQVYGNYTMASYMVCILGGYLADNFIGARRAVLVGGLIITVGHYALAFDSVPTFYAGLILIALGTGLLKPSISTLVGGLYSHGDTRRDAGFSLFYMGINLGAFAAPLVVGWLAQSESFRVVLSGWGLDPTHSWHWGFGAAGIGMTFGMVVYLRRLHWLSHVGQAPEADAPRPWIGLTLVTLGTATLLAVMIASDYVAWINPVVYALPIVGIVWFGVVRRDEDSRRIAAILVFFVCAILFWAVFEQAGSSLTLFAEDLTHNELLGFAFPSSWFQSVNSLFILALAPLFAWLWVRLREQQPSMPMKFVWGLVFLGLSFALLVPAAKLTAEGKVSPWWLIAVYFLQTIGELCLSPVGLSAMTKLAPAKLAGLVMGIWFLGTALGNKLAGVVAAEFNAQDPQALAHFFWQQALLVGGLTVLLLVLVPWVRRLTGETTR